MHICLCGSKNIQVIPSNVCAIKPYVLSFREHKVNCIGNYPKRYPILRLFSNFCSAMRKVDLSDKTHGKKRKIMQISAIVPIEAILRMQL